MEIAPTTEWLVYFIVLSLVAGAFIWIGVKIAAGRMISVGDYFTAVFVGAATILAINFARHFLEGGIGVLGGDIVSAIVALAIITIFIHMAYDIGFVKSLVAAVIAVVAIFVAIYVFSAMDINTSIIREVAQETGGSA